MLQKIILIAPLFFIFAYKAYKSFRYADSKIQLGKFTLGFMLIVLTLVALYSLTIAGLSGYAFLAFVLTAYLLVPGPLLGLVVGSAVGISVREWKSEKQSHKTIVTACWLFILLVGVIYFALWQQRETFQHKNRVKTQLALDFVKGHSAVIEKVGSNPTPALTSMIFPKETTPDNHYPLPIGYVISIDNQQHLYAVVSTPMAAEDLTFTLDCITPLIHDERYGNRDRCK
ncbi:MAG: hypothetical protein PHY62_04665 [Gallionella sp.]|nr:hypothetical protein [Gallionella sp.]